MVHSFFLHLFPLRLFLFAHAGKEQGTGPYWQVEALSDFQQGKSSGVLQHFVLW